MRLRLLDHPIHAVVVAFPIALLGLVPVWDVMARLPIAAAADARSVGYFCELVGLIGGGLAVTSGFVDFMKLPSDSDAAKTALVHASFALGVVTLFAIAFALRGGRAAIPGALVLALELAGAVLLAFTGWFGGELVFRHGVGVRGRDGGR